MASRRSLLKGVLGALVAVPFGTLSPVEAAARISAGPDGGPPRLRSERKPPPRHGYFWVSGHWEWSNRNHTYVWVPGRWIRNRPGFRYRPSHWIRRNRRWMFVPGAWTR